MELLGVPRASVDALRRVCQLTFNPTREEIQELRSSGILWLTPLPPWSGQPPTVEDSAAATSSLEALLRLRRLDYDVWFTAIEKLWPESIKKLRQRQLLSRNLVLGVKYDPSCERTFIRNYSYFVRHWYPDGDVNEPDESLHTIPVHLELVIHTRDRTPSRGNLVENACEGVERVRDRFAQRDSGHPLFRFVVARVKKRLGVSVSINEENLRWFRRLAACGVRVVHTMSPSATWVERDVVPRVIPLVQDLLATNVTTRSRGMESMTVRLGDQPQLVDSVCSAITASRSVRHVVVVAGISVGVGDHRERVWQWLAILFRRSIESCTINCLGLTMEDTQCLEAIRDVSDPLAWIFPSTTLPVDDSGAACVATASRFCLYTPSTEPHVIDANASTLTYDSPIENLQVLSIEDDWVSVVLPGWGRAWTARTDASIAKMPPLPPPSNYSGFGTKRLSLTLLLERHKPVVRALLRQIGDQVTSLSLSSYRSIPAQDFVEGALQMCPNLEELTIKSLSLPTLSLFTRAFDQGTLRLERLFLDNISLEDQVDSLLFFHSLADPDHPMARQVRVFSCTLGGQEHYFPSIKPVIARLLQQNNRLDEFELDVGHTTYFLGPDDTVTQQEVDEWNRPRLSLRSKLALLSVVWTHERVSGSSASSGSRPLHALDRDVLSTIFEFASRAPFVRVRF